MNIKIKKFTQIPNWIIINEKITDSSFRTYVVLKSFKFGSNDPFPSQATLAGLRAKSKKSIIEHLKSLKNLGFLIYKKRGFSSSNQYQFIGEDNYTDDSEEIVTTKTKEISPLNSRNLQPNNTKFNKTKINNLQGDNNNSYKERELTPEEEDLVEKIVEWNIRPIFNTLLPEKRVRMMVKNTVKKYGFKEVWEIYDEVANKSYAPHPMDFWNEIKELKEEKK